MHNKGLLLLKDSSAWISKAKVEVMKNVDPMEDLPTQRRLTDIALLIVEDIGTTKEDTMIEIIPREGWDKEIRTTDLGDTPIGIDELQKVVVEEIGTKNLITLPMQCLPTDIALLIVEDKGTTAAEETMIEIIPGEGRDKEIRTTDLGDTPVGIYELQKVVTEEI